MPRTTKDEVVETTDSQPTQPVVAGADFVESLDASLTNLNASARYKIAPEIPTGVNTKEDEDPHFHKNTPPEKIASIKQELGQEILPGIRPDLDALYEHFNEFFPAEDGFRMFINSTDMKFNGVPLTVLVPLRYSDMNSEELALCGCHRVTTHINSLKKEQVAEILEERYNKILGILSKYNKRRN